MRKRFSWSHWKRWKHSVECRQNALDKMQIPLPIPHPVAIAIEIYNRDSDDPIHIDSVDSLEILKAFEQASGEQAPSYVARYRGGASEFNVQTGESLGSLLSDHNNDDDDGADNDDEDNETSDRDEDMSLMSDKKAMANGGDAETLPCGVSASDVVVKDSNSDKNPPQTFYWTLSNWGSTHTDSNTVRVDLASPEDITISEDNMKISSYGTNV